MAEQQDPTLNLNVVEAQELQEHQYAAGSKVAGATDPYATAAGLPEGTSGFSPAVPPAAAAAAKAAGSEEPHPGGLAKVAQGVKGALGLGGGSAGPK